MKLWSTRAMQIPKHTSLLRITFHIKLHVYMQNLCLKKSPYVTKLYTRALIYVRVSFTVQMSLSCSQSKFMMLNQHIWSIFNLQQQIVWSRLIIFSMVVGKLCSKEHSTRTVRKKIQISTLEKQIVSFLACLMEQLRETKKQNKKRKKINTCKEK